MDEWMYGKVTTIAQFVLSKLDWTDLDVRFLFHWPLSVVRKVMSLDTLILRQDRALRTQNSQNSRTVTVPLPSNVRTEIFLTIRDYLTFMLQWHFYIRMIRMLQSGPFGVNYPAQLYIRFCATQRQYMYIFDGKLLNGLNANPNLCFRQPTIQDGGRSRK